VSGLVYRAHQGLEVSDGIINQGESLELRVTTKDPTDADIDMTVERTPDVLDIPLGIHDGEIPHHDDIAVTLGRGVATDLQPPKISSKRSLRARS